MQHVSDAGPSALPAHLEEQRTRMSVRTDAPAHTSTVEAAGAYAASGLENSFSLERFMRDFRVEIQSLSEEEAVFDLIGIDAALANAVEMLVLRCCQRRRASFQVSMQRKLVVRPLLRARCLLVKLFYGSGVLLALHSKLANLNVI